MCVCACVCVAQQTCFFGEDVPLPLRRFSGSKQQLQHVTPHRLSRVVRLVPEQSDAVQALRSVALVDTRVRSQQRLQTPAVEWGSPNEHTKLSSGAENNTNHGSLQNLSCTTSVMFLWHNCTHTHTHTHTHNIRAVHHGQRRTDLMSEEVRAMAKSAVSPSLLATFTEAPADRNTHAAFFQLYSNQISTFLDRQSKAQAVCLHVRCHQTP